MQSVGAILLIGSPRVKILKVWIFCTKANSQNLLEIPVLNLTPEQQNKDKVAGVGRGTRQSPRHLSCLLSRTYQTGGNGCDGCGRPRSNAVDWATQVSQQSTRYQGHKVELVGTSLFSCIEHVREEGPLTWVLYETQSKQGVLAWSIGRASRESQLDSSVEQWTSQDRMLLQTSKQMLRTVPFLSKWKENLLLFHSKE